MEGIPLLFIDFRGEFVRPSLTRISSSCLKSENITIRTSRYRHCVPGTCGAYTGGRASPVVSMSDIIEY
jgi:hypothetical protein